MTIKETQNTIDEWIKEYGVRYFDPMTNLAVLMEEVGELSRVFARKYGEQSFKEGEHDNVEEEMADVLWVLMCLANQTGVDLTSALQKSIEKKTRRDSQRHKNNPKLLSVMKAELQQIKLGEGLGVVKFGMSRSHIVSLLGKPDEKELIPALDDEGDGIENWHYDEYELSLGFDEDKDWQLVTISVTSPYYVLGEIAMVGQSLDKVENALQHAGINDLELEDAEEGQNLFSEDGEFSLWFEDSILVEVQWSRL